MERREFQGYNCDLIELQNKIEIYFVGKNYKATSFHKGKTYLVQAYKDEMGENAILTQIEGTPKEFKASIGFGPRIKNIKDASLKEIPWQIKLVLGEPILENNFWDFFTTLAELKRNSHGRAKAKWAKQHRAWQEREIVREIEVVYCRYCGGKNNARLTRCTQCGGKLR
jgi:hypothetical protein